MNTLRKYGILDSMAEKVIYDLLTELLDTNSYLILPQILLHNVLGIKLPDLEDQVEHFSKLFPEIDYDKQTFSPALLRFDFVICNKNFLSVLIIEVNGPHHKTDKRNTFYDCFKRFKLEQENLKLITIDTDSFYSSERQEDKYNIQQARNILSGKLYEYNKFSTLTCYCPKCYDKLKYTQNRTTGIYFLQCNNCKDKAQSPYGWNESEYAKYFKPLLKER